MYLQIHIRLFFFLVSLEHHDFHSKFVFWYKAKEQLPETAVQRHCRFMNFWLTSVQFKRLSCCFVKSTPSLLLHVVLLERALLCSLCHFLILLLAKSFQYKKNKKHSSSQLKYFIWTVTKKSCLLIIKMCRKHAN